ncbi:MAG: 50S ribosomal protein L4 [Gemmatimonadetes bacterium]|nr:50S ribosomal protein L4 [Gemmatimonadota bacterium]
MFKARYYKTDGKKGRNRSLPDVLFDGVVNDAVLHHVVKAYLANQRQGTHAAKSRAQVAGGSRKPWRQKGTGRARQGTIRAAQWAGGGRAFPPIPHSWNQKIPRKVKALARRSAFNARAAEDRVVLIDALAMDAPKTAALRDYLASIELGGAKVLVLTDGLSEAVHLSARNLPHVEVRAFGTESVYDVLWADSVVIERGALEGLEAAPAGDTAAAEVDEPATEDAGSGGSDEEAGDA